MKAAEIKPVLEMKLAYLSGRYIVSQETCQVVTAT